jgi:hypothetical protein
MHPVRLAPVGEPYRWCDAATGLESGKPDQPPARLPVRETVQLFRPRARAPKADSERFLGHLAPPPAPLQASRYSAPYSARPATASAPLGTPSSARPSHWFVTALTRARASCAQPGQPSCSREPRASSSLSVRSSAYRNAYSPLAPRRRSVWLSCSAAPGPPMRVFDERTSRGPAYLYKVKDVSVRRAGRTSWAGERSRSTQSRTLRFMVRWAMPARCPV